MLDDLSEWTVQLGMTRRHSHSFFGRKVKVEKIIRHELYNIGPVQHDHDIALFKVGTKIDRDIVWSLENSRKLICERYDRQFYFVYIQ